MTTRSSRKKQRQRLTALLVAMLLLVIAVVLALAIGSGGNGTLAGDPASLPASAAPPPVEPLALMQISEDAARAANAQQPFITGGFPAALPFRFTGDALNAARATDCLAAAVLYEAGDDADGQRAVAQVIINRARHPSYPKSICGVVFQGSERSTGCQFTFTCDGALARRWSDGAWERARGIAIDMLSGATYEGVGLATHYHTDWVRPYWSASLDKLAQVGTHLFFRIPGVWGSPAAYRGQLNGQEPVIAKLAGLSSVHAAGAQELGLTIPTTSTVSPAAVTAAVSAIIPRRDLQLGDTIILTLDRTQPPESFPALAESACGARPYCKVMGWTNPALAPAPATDSEEMGDMARASMSFSYLRDEARGLERALWNCDEFARDQRTQCMRRGN